MKKLSLILLSALVSVWVLAQNQTSIDKEKLFDLYQTQKYAEAADYLRNVYGENNRDLKALTQIGYCYMMAGKTADAEKFYTSAYQLQPQNLSILFNLASIAGKRGNNNKSKSLYEEIIKIDSNNFSPYKQLANLETDLISVKKIIYLKKANKLNPVDADVVFDLAELYMKSNLHGMASNILAPALKADSTNIQLLKIKLPLCLVQAKFDEAINTGEKLFAQGDSSSFVLNNLGKVYYMKKDFQKGLNYFKKVSAQAAEDTNEGLFYNIALCYRGLKDYNSAAQYFTKAINAGISKKTLLYYTKLGESFEQDEKFESAAAAYRKGAFFDNEGNMLYILAQIYDTKLNQKTNAINTYAQVLKVLPNTDGNKEVFEFINKRMAILKK
ncbi:tetratricopeptide repeat protein [Pedobacter aquatilis]|uniref:tetratricopeptide repeat protein n=1 Tax=Pedobacter aquatilis TaxID=351343 RepID=UPI0025B4B1A2|nr:tetratricopeptide repeat protein [Pedobacter aquatilis]MDN3586299.1 tetratricopeptide repeat protein [Pedobacter aquatilis]